MSKYTWAIVVLITILAAPSIIHAQEDSEWNTKTVDQSGSGGSIAIDSNGNPHIVYAHWFYEKKHDTMGTSLYYAVWKDSQWNILTVDQAGGDGQIAIDSQNRPHIIYVSNNNIKYSVLKDGEWTAQTVDSSVSRSHAMTLDSNGNPHLVYSKFDYVNNSYIDYVKYADFDGTNWNIQTIDTVKRGNTYGDFSPSIALDSNNNPQIIYLDKVDFQPPVKTKYMSIYQLYNIRYAYLADSKWQIQTVFTNSSSISNIVLNSMRQPSFIYSHTDFTYLPSDRLFQTSSTVNYAYWTGLDWASRTIDSKPSPSRDMYLNLDSNGNPQVYFINGNNQNSNESGLMYTHLDGLGWQTEALGRLPENEAYYEDSLGVADIAFDASGNPSISTYGEVGTLRSAAIWGGLTYITLKTPLHSEIFDYRLIAIPVVAVILGITLFFCIRIFAKKPA